MKSIQSIISIVLVLVVAISTTSCEKVIDINTNNSIPQLVIEGNISNVPGPYTIKLSTSVNYDQTNSFPAVQNAVVKISDNKGNSETLKETTAGIYQTATLNGTVGTTYTLYIKTTDNKEYTASSTMPALVALDDLKIQKSTFKSSDEDTLEAVVYFTDPKGLGNNYRFIQYINSVASKAINITNDKYFDGNSTNFSLFRKDKEYIKKGDSVSVEMRNIDKANYDYFNSLENIVDRPDNPAPANPVSSITGGALGYFCAYSVSQKSVIVK
ncbi:DUF4249 domain-containing protein [Pinibacter aurantiacus]|uniref:DUF4249 domain-containing protein n=1 Tax=Pinibacter aurantiacus TaxID=2851599 RepID=A0A9E2SD41_9BACT|nr:DUF4249 domain-containing protein [Pinibacter aurantiacus]MBV4359379.1 DUF4249 domain-containing protein [Pinibacter aurantiacus]